MFHSADALLRHQRQRFSRVRHIAQAEHLQLTEEMRQDAIDLSSGNVSTKTLRKLGHPFGRRASGRMRGLKGKHRIQGFRVPLLPINRQEGNLRSGWRLAKSRSANLQWADLSNVAPYAKYVLAIGGTKRMVSRGFWQELKKRWRKRNFQLLLRLRDAGKG